MTNTFLGATLPAFFRMRNGEKAEVFAERDGRLMGWRLQGGNPRSDDWGLSGQWGHITSSGFDLLSLWTEPRKPFECWVNRYENPATLIAAPTQREADAFDRKRIGPAVRMIESTPLTAAAGEMYEALEAVEPRCLASLDGHAESGDHHIRQQIRAVLAKAKP